MPFYNFGKGTVKVGDLVYGLQEPRDAFWTRYNRVQEKVFVIEQFHIINGDSEAYNRVSGEALEGFRNALRSHAKFNSAVPSGTPTSGGVDPDNPRGNEDIRRKDKGGLDWAVKSTNPDRQVHFILTGLKMSLVVNKAGPADQGSGADKTRSITGAELRWIYRNRHRTDVQARIQFWRSKMTPLSPTSPIVLPMDSACVPPWDDAYDDPGNPPSLWKNYVPKGETTI